MIFLRALSDIESCFFFPNVQKKKKKKKGDGVIAAAEVDEITSVFFVHWISQRFSFWCKLAHQIKKHNSRCNDIVVLGPKIDYFIPLRTAMGLDS